MYKIYSVKIDSFWYRFNVSGRFNEDVNIIIGRNGTGKTTFMNILNSVLAVDVYGISVNDFRSVSIMLRDGNSTKTINVEKTDDDSTPFLRVVYRISNKKYNVRIFPTENQRMVSHYRRRSIEDSEEVRKILSSLVSLSSLSVYRLRSDQDYEVRERYGKKSISPVDFRLSELLKGLTHYQLDLSQKARAVAMKLQRDVLISILYTPEEKTDRKISFDFDKERERKKLLSAYGQLSAIDNVVKEKINIHVDAIERAVKKIQDFTNHKKNKDGVIDIEIDFESLEALRQTRKIMELSLDAERETSTIFSQINLFIESISQFITDKKFSFNNGDLLIEANDEEIDYNRLSSGEKQLLIIFIETLLQKQAPYIFLTDEPELSLHIAWQRKIIPAIKKINPNAQIIAATHSPEVASKYRDSIIDMEDLING